MESHRAGDILFRAEEAGDLEYIRVVSEHICRECSGDRQRWSLTPDQMWKVFFGARNSVLGIRLDGRVSCVKLYADARLQTRLRVLAGFAKGKRAYRNAVRLRQRGINCPRMLGYAERRPAGPAMIITELIETGLRLDHWASRHGIQEDVALALARFLRNMHDQGVAHIDLSPRNILIRARGDGYEFLLLDYEDVRFAPHVSRRVRLRNLNHLHERMARCVSVRERLRFLHAYAGIEYDAWKEDLRRMIRRSRSRHLKDLQDR